MTKKKGPVEPPKKWTVSTDEMKEIIRQQKDLLGIRGRVIDSTIDIERILGEILIRAIVGGSKNIEGESLFGDIVLEEIMFSGKIKMLERLIKNIHSRSDPLKYKKMFEGINTEELLSNLKKLNTYRNRFAHGDIIFKSTQAYLFYSRNRDDKLTDDYFDKLNSLFSSTYATLVEVLLKANLMYHFK